MSRRDPSRRRFTPHIPFALMAAWLAILWIAGGASRADVAGQVVVRGAAWAILIALILIVPLPRLRPVAPVAFFVIGAAVLVALQLVPLPPGLWTALPGRDLLAQAALVTGQDQPWRPLSISPGATFNSLSSLIVPILTLALLATLQPRERRRMAPLFLGVVAASALLGLLQFSGGRFDNPLINDVPRAVSATFANRNHFALFASIGCLLAFAWGFREASSRARWKKPTAIGLVLLFALIVLATGSRTGMVVGVLGVGIGLLLVWRQIGAELRRLPRPVAIALVCASIGVVAILIVLSIVLGRAVSVDRALELDVGQDLRREALPTVWSMVQLYFPFGSGAGAFDPVYRIHEPDALLSRVYFNHAHNDFLEIVLDAGLPGLLLLVGAVVWWLWRSLQVWRASATETMLPRLGSAILFLVFVASITDYPARTPMIMAIMVVAGVWLHGAGLRDEARQRPGEPADRQDGQSD